MVNLKFGAFLFALCLLLKTCVCETPCTIKDTTATCTSNEDFKSLHGVTNITKLIVRSQQLKKIHKDDLAEFVNLEEIDLSNSGLQEIDENAFAGLVKLHKINLAENTNLKVPNDVSFLASNTLTCLNLSHTVVEQLDKTFAHLPKLENLDLSGTNVKDFSPLKLQEHLNKLVVSKTSETKDLCNVLPIKEIFEKDASGAEVQLDCKSESIEVPQGKEQAATPKVEQPPVVTTPKMEQPPTVTTPKMEQPSVVTTPKLEQPPAETTPKMEQPPAGTTPKMEQPPVGATPKMEQPPATNKNDETKTKTSETTVATITSSTKEPKNDTRSLKNKADADDKKKDDKKIVAIDAIPETPKDPTENTEVTSKTETTTNEVKTETVDSVTTEQPKSNNEEQTDTTTEKNASEDNNKISPNNTVLSGSSIEEILPSTANTSQSNGVNIVLGIILCVMIVGAIGFGYKYWKNRRSGYTHANTQDNDDEDKELQTIVAHRTDTDQN